MKIMKTVLIILAILVVLIIAVYAYYGGFSKISFRIENQGGETIVYENLTGDYMQSAKVGNSIYYTLLNDEKIATTKGIGIYYDDPKKVAKEKLRSEHGCIIENVDSTTLARLAEKYQVKTLPQSEFVVTEFPFKGKLSVLLGLMKVYPALEKYYKEHGYIESPVTEIYDVPNKKIIYRQETKKD
jgi:preprotein translocase subunit SecF